jgi:hypothetical protein
LTEREIKMTVIDYAEQIAKAIKKGNDISITGVSNGVAIKEQKVTRINK